jgi:hypothetical protein
VSKRQRTSFEHYALEGHYLLIGAVEAAEKELSASQALVSV